MYTELHSHSAFSFLDGASLPEQLVLEAARLGFAALALTDHNGLYGSMAFAQAAKQHGIQPITGAEVTMLDGSHVTLLAETPRGYANLCRLLTEAHLGRADRRDPRLDFASLEARHEGLVLRNGLPVGRGETVRLAITSERWLTNGVQGVPGIPRSFAGLGVGIYFGLKAKDISDQISEHDKMMMWPDNIQDLEDEGQAHENKQIAFMIAGGALVGFGTIAHTTDGGGRHSTLAVSVHSSRASGQHSACGSSPGVRT